MTGFVFNLIMSRRVARARAVAGVGVGGSAKLGLVICKGLSSVVVETAEMPACLLFYRISYIRLFCKKNLMGHNAIKLLITAIDSPFRVYSLT